jgi:hypothetical protein
MINGMVAYSQVVAMGPRLAGRVIRYRARACW